MSTEKSPLFAIFEFVSYSTAVCICCRSSTKQTVALFWFVVNKLTYVAGRPASFKFTFKNRQRRFIFYL